ncbi:MAG: hypothetical protein SWJ54_02260 [Cyanobacteriota bacterium]|nr:hypothetical protein [Cyanobacteriota bacterium]
MLAKTPPINETTLMNAAQIFPLIDSILPFEVCLHYQVLPLSLADDCLQLGMVYPDDDSALDYINKILAYRHLSIVTQTISFPNQESILSAYLYHNQHPNSEIKTPDLSSKNKSKPNQKEPSPNKKSKPNSKNSVTSQVNAAKKTQKNNLPSLSIQTDHLNEPIEVLATLTPEKILHELLGRTLKGGIGRLYFERQASTGRVLWSKDGVLKSVLEDLEASLFQGIINELKQLLEISLIPVDKLKQATIERLYQGNHILLRLRVLPGEYGEEANLQVLRGAALKFHQQHKMTVLSQDALQLAQQLEKKLQEIEQRSDSAPLPSENLPLLTQLLANINQKIEGLQQKDEN